MLKTCTKCKIPKPISEFGKQTQGEGGIRSRCRACRAVEKKLYRAANAEKIKESSRAYKATNQPKIKAYREATKKEKAAVDKAYREANVEACKARSKSYRTRNISTIRSNKKAYRASHKEQIQIKKRAEYVATKDRVLTRNHTNRRHNTSVRLKREYGITMEQYDQMLLSQGNVCMICKGVNTHGVRLAVDHDHITKRVRGLLCHRCNTMLGHARDTPAILHAGIEYLNRWASTSPPGDEC